jgi:hypothetical protein
MLEWKKRSNRVATIMGSFCRGEGNMIGQGISQMTQTEVLVQAALVNMIGDWLLPTLFAGTVITRSYGFWSLIHIEFTYINKELEHSC